MLLLHIIGSKLKRAKTSVRTIGPAVTNGGITTLLSVIMLCGSQSHVFITFWKIFCLTVIFGLFHGVVLLPVVLCYLGPNKTEAPRSAVSKQGTENKTSSAGSDGQQITDVATESDKTVVI